MSAALMTTALRNLASTVRQVNVQTEPEHQTLCDASTLLRVLANLLDGMGHIKAFGPPGDWGYDTELGKAVIALRAGTCAGAGDAIEAEFAWRRDNEITLSVLMLVGGHDVTAEAIAGWTDEQCRAAEDWAAREHLHASDNDDVERVPMPAWVAAHPPKASTGLGLWD